MRIWMRLCVIVGAVALSAACAASATAAGTPSGVTPDIPAGVHAPPAVTRSPAASLEWQGGPVMHSNRTHVIFWNPSNCAFNSHACSYDSGYQALVQQFLTNVAADSHKATNVFAISGQYFDNGGHSVYDSTFAGALTDTDSAPANGCTLPPTAPSGWALCLSDSQLRTELASFISAHNLPNTPVDIYLLVTPEGFGTCFGAGPSSCSLGGSTFAGYCGYHDFFGVTSSAPGLYANIPFNAETGHCASSNPRPNNNTADPALSTLSHEQS
jgi:hypothetical protein